MDAANFINSLRVGKVYKFFPHADFAMSVTQPETRRAGGSFQPAARIAENARQTEAGLNIEVSDDPAAVEEVWSELEAVAQASVYQTRRFVLPWLAAFSRPRGITPMFVVARDARNVAVAFLPLGVVRRGPLRIAGFLGGKDSNANLPLLKPGTRLAGGALRAALRAAAVQSALRPDAFVLLNQPRQWEGEENPLLTLSHRPSPSSLYRGGLDGTRKLSKDFAKKLRQKRRWLEALGKVEYVTGTEPEKAATIPDAFLAQKLQRFDDKNIDSEFGTPESRAFMEALALRGGNLPPALEWSALTLDGRVIATYGGGGHRKCFYFMVNSFDATPEIARCSPGDLLLHDILEEKRAAGYATFDLGIGEARYKNSWCDEKVELFDTALPVTARGAAFAFFESSRLTAKRWVKQNAWASDLARRASGVARAAGLR